MADSVIGVTIGAIFIFIIVWGCVVCIKKYRGGTNHENIVGVLPSGVGSNLVFATQPRQEISLNTYRTTLTDDCLICLTTLNTRNVTSFLCTHTYHTDCIVEWLKKKDTCPTCRTLIEGSNTLREAFTPTSEGDEMV